MSQVRYVTSQDTQQMNVGKDMMTLFYHYLNTLEGVNQLDQRLKAAYIANFNPFTNYAAPTIEEQYVAPYSSYNHISHSSYSSIETVVPEAYLTNYEEPADE